MMRVFGRIAMILVPDPRTEKIQAAVSIQERNYPEYSLAFYRMIYDIAEKIIRELNF